MAKKTKLQKLIIDGLSATATIGGRKYGLEACDEEGCDWSDDGEPTHFKMVETTYKNRTDAGQVKTIQKLSNLPEAICEEGNDEDGDHFWRVWFPISAFPVVTRK